MKIRLSAAILAPAVAGVAVGALLMPAHIEPVSAFTIPADSTTIGGDFVDGREVAAKLRSDLNGKIDAIKADVAANKVKSEKLEELAALITADVAEKMQPSDDEITARLGLLTTESALDELKESLTKQASDVAELAGVWKDLTASEAERIRVAAEKKAAEDLAAKQSAEAAVTPEAQDPAPSNADSNGPSAPAGNFTLRIAGSGDQALIDACAGAVWWTPWPGVLAEHWHCGGSAFPKDAGVLVDIPGAGTYKTAGIVAVVNGPQSNTSDIPTGYDLVYQTCLNNDNTTTGFVGLIKVG